MTEEEEDNEAAASATEDPAVAGIIMPAEDESAPAIFKVIDREQDQEVHHIGVPNVRPCDHISGGVTYILDEKWQTVTCSKCKQHIPAFAVLMLYSKWNQRHRNDRYAAIEAQKSLHCAELRRLAKLRGILPAEAEAIAGALRERYRKPAREMAKLVASIEDALRDRKYEAERKKDPVKGRLPPTKVTVIGGSVPPKKGA